MKVIRDIKILLISGFLLGSVSVFGQCDADMFLDQCANGLGTYNYIKSFSIKVPLHKRINPECSYVFSKGSTYLLIACDQNLKGGKMILSLYDREHNLIASTFNEKDNRYYSDLRYSCETTGVYYITASFKGSKGGCGMCILGFNRE
jgi:hypothetical protein